MATSTRLSLSMGDLEGLAHLQGAEVAHPGRPGGQGGEGQEGPGMGGQGQGIGPLAGEHHEGGQHQQDDEGAHQGGQVGIHPLQADLGEDGSEGGEHRREQGPVEPGQAAIHDGLYRSRARRSSRPPAMGGHQ